MAASLGRRGGGKMIKYIVDPDFEPSLELFTDALAILKTIRRF